MFVCVCVHVCVCVCVYVFVSVFAVCLCMHGFYELFTVLPGKSWRGPSSFVFDIHLTRQFTRHTCAASVTKSWEVSLVMGVSCNWLCVLLFFCCCFFLPPLVEEFTFILSATFKCQFMMLSITTSLSGKTHDHSFFKKDYTVSLGQCSWRIKLPADSTIHSWHFTWGLRDLRCAVVGKQG